MQSLTEIELITPPMPNPDPQEPRPDPEPQPGDDPDLVPGPGQPLPEPMPLESSSEFRVPSYEFRRFIGPFVHRIIGIGSTAAEDGPATAGVDASATRRKTARREGGASLIR